MTNETKKMIAVDAEALRHADSRTADRMLAEAFGCVRYRVMRGEKLPAPAQQLEHEAPREIRPASKDHVKATLNDIYATLGMTPRGAA